MRKLTFITTPMDMNRPKLLFGDAADRCLPAFLEWLRAHAADWDILDIDEQKPDATTDEIHEFFGKMGCLIARSETICPYLPLVGTWDEFLTGRSRKMRSNVNRLRRRISDRGEIVIRRITSGPDIESAIDSHCEIEAQSWKAEKNLHLSGDKSHYFFHKSLARVFGAKGAFQLRRLECAGKPVASTYGIEHEGVFHSMKIAHDQAYDACSPGTVLESFELEDLFGSGLARYEFMGSFLANKLRWTSDVHRTVNVHIYQRCVRLSIFFFVFFILKRKVKAVLKSSGQFERVDSLLNRFGKSPFPRY
jgi:hypothetical protein